VSSKRILVVDDDPKFLRFVTELLIGAAYDVRGTADPLVAAGLAEEFNPDLMILDLSMPGKDGVELARELGACAKTSGIPVMFLTARRAAEGMESAKDSGAVAYVEKPVQTSKLLWVIKALLEGEGKISGAGIR
jgi:DNA-binding response OmpR family regulator